MNFSTNFPINSCGIQAETNSSQGESIEKGSISLIKNSFFSHIFSRMLLISFIMISCLGGLMAQFTGMVNSTESRCIADGTINISGASTTSIYAVTGQGYPQTTQGPGSTNYLFETLPPGNFTVTEFKTDNTEHTFMISVPGNYQQNWQFTANVTFGDCMDGEVGTITIGNFTITNATLAQQRPPYEFRISEPNGVLPANGQGLPEYEDVEEFVFPNTVAGSSFQMQARDSCGNFKTYNIQVPSNSPQPNLNFTRLGYENCDGDAEYNFNATGGTAPYLFEVISSTQPGDPLVGMTSTTNPTFWILQGSTTYVVSVRDECGSIRTRSINVPAYSAPCLSATGAPGNCGDPGEEGNGALVVTTCQNGIGPYTLTVVSVGCGYNETFDNVPPSFTLNNLPRPCDYVITITDGCMEQRTINVGLDGPSDASLSCNHNFLCPSSGSELIRLETNVTNGPPYNPTYPLTIDITEGGISLPGYPKVMTENSGRRNTQSLEPGMYTYLITDACGITCSQTVDVPLYESPTATVDSDQQCYGSGQMIIVGVNGNPLNNSSDIYSIVAGPNFIGKTSESDAPPGTGMFSNLISDGTYTFRYFDGCKEFLLQEQVPTWTQPTYEVGYGLICGDDNSANLNMINLQPEGEVALPYHWILQSTNSNQYAGPLPFPNNVGQTDSVFMNLVPNMNGSTATYFFLGYDNCKNSYQAAGSVGFFPDNELILSSYSVCPGPDAVVTARVSVPIVGGTYEIFRDGELLVTTTNLFTTIQPALPGLYTARITVLNNDNVECEYVTEHVEITAIGELNITDPEGKCPTEGVDLTDPAITVGSSPGVLTYWLDEALTQPLPNPDFVVTAGTYYINLITDGPVSCNLTAPVEVVSISCCPEIFVQSSVVVDANCNEENATIVVTPVGSEFGYIFRWENEMGDVVSTTNTVTNVGPGVYTVYISADLDGCDDETIYVVVVGTLEGPIIEIVEINDENCGDGTGNVTIDINGGESPYEIIWSNGNDSPINENLSEGGYSVTVTDAGGCQEVGYVEIGNGSGDFEIDVTSFDSECGMANGSAEAEAIGETLPVEYLWNTGATTSMIENLPSGVYSVTATDGNGCVVEETVIVTDSPGSGAPEIEIVIVENVSCTGDADGVVEFLPTEDIVYRVFNSEGLLISVGPIATDLIAGTYTVEATDDLGCKTIEEFNISQPANIFDVSITGLGDSQCDNAGTGFIVIEVVGGKSPYTYLWSGPNGFSSTDMNPTNLFHGEYSVTVTDDNDCVLMAMVEIDVFDTEEPIITLCDIEENVMVECEGEDNIQIVEDWHNNNLAELAQCITDDSDFEVLSDYDFTMDQLVDGCSDYTGTYMVTYWAVDDCGFISEELVLSISLVDTTSPDLLECDLEELSITIECVGDPETQIAEWLEANIAFLTECATDVCSEFEVTSNVDDVDFIEGCSATTGEITVTFTVTDECGNEISTDATLTIEDTTSPDLSECDLEELSITIECVGDPETQIVEWVEANIETLTNCATDVCSEFEVTSNVDDVDFVEGCSETTGEITVTFTITDECGNEISTDATLTIEDTTSPDLSACDLDELSITIECVGDPETQITEWVEANIETLTNCATDVCSEFEVTSNVDDVDFVEGCSETTGEITVTFTVTDECGNEITTDATLTIEDTTAPDLTECDLDALSITVECIGDPESQIADWNTANIATLTNCATDICSEFEVTSNVDEVDFIEGCSATTGEITVTFTVTDECGNEITTDATLTIEDTTAPDLTECDLEALSITVECIGDPESQIAEWNAANIATLTSCATDICSEFEVTSNVDDVNFIEDCSATTGEITVTFTVTDECGNAISTEATLTIVDTTAPDISNCPNTDLTIECESTENETNAENWNSANIASLLACATDACSETFVVISDFDWDNYITSCGDAGSIEVTYQVVDECGNISNDFVSTLVIEDTTPPVVEILDELFIYDGLVEVECNSNIEDWEYPTLTLEEIATSDNCGSVELSLENEFTIAEDCAEAGYMMEHYYLITAIDQCDNVTTVESTLRIVDTTAPEIFGVPEDITVDCANIPECPEMGSCEDASSELVTSFDNCECGTLEYEEITVNQTCEYNYTLIRRWTATDKCGNITVEEQVITVQDETAPELILANPSLRDIQNGEQIKVDCEAWGLPDWVIEIDENAVLAVDGCIGGIEVEFTETVEHGFQCTTDGYFDKISYNWSAEDACGNVSEFGFVILLTDNTAPVITGPQTICDSNPENSGLEVTEACSSVISWDFEDRVIKDDCMGEGILREWLAVDACNNMSFFEQYIFEEMPAPIVEVKSEMMPIGTGNGSFIQLNCSDEYMLEEFRKAEVTVDGGCESDLEVIFTEEVQSEVGCEDNILSVVVLRWTATDRCGQEGVYEVFVNLFDDRAPSFFGNDREVSFECGEEIALPKVTDNCSAVDLVLISEDTIPGAMCANDLILAQSFRATDLCGNTSEFRRRVNIYDLKAPEFISIKEIVCAGELNEPEVIDGCGGEVELSFEDVAALETCGNISSVRRIWTARDACGNSSSFEQTVIMSSDYGQIDVTNPFLGSLSENETYKVECSLLPIDFVEAFKPTDVLEFGSCSLVDVNVQVRVNTEGDCSVDGFLYDFNITYIIESVCLGKKEFRVNVQIIDTTAPVFEYAPESVEIYCENEDSLAQPIIVDECSDVTVEYKEVRTNLPGGDGTEGNYRLERTWIATDRCGNISTHTQDVRFYSYELEAEIILVNPPQCNSNRNQATVIIFNGTGPFKYEWTVLSGECEILGNRFLQTVRYKIGFSPVTLQVKITDSFGCVVTRTITFICTNIEVRSSEDGSNLEAAEMVLYPNPTKDRLNLNWKSEKSTSMEFRIYSGVGEIILDKKMIQNEGNNYLEFEISHFAPGIYNLEIIEGSNVAYKRFIVVD